MSYNCSTLSGDTIHSWFSIASSSSISLKYSLMHPEFEQSVEMDWANQSCWRDRLTRWKNAATLLCSSLLLPSSSSQWSSVRVSCDCWSSDLHIGAFRSAEANRPSSSPSISLSISILLSCWTPLIIDQSCHQRCCFCLLGCFIRCMGSEQFISSTEQETDFSNHFWISDLKTTETAQHSTQEWLSSSSSFRPLLVPPTYSGWQNWHQYQACQGYSRFQIENGSMKLSLWSNWVCIRYQKRPCLILLLWDSWMDFKTPEWPEFPIFWCLNHQLLFCGLNLLRSTN